MASESMARHCAPVDMMPNFLCASALAVLLGDEVGGEEEEALGEGGEEEESNCKATLILASKIPRMGML